MEADLVRLYRLLAGTGLPCMVGGGFAAILFGEPRTTLDIDIAIACQPADDERIAAAFPEGRLYVPPIEVMRREIGRGARGSLRDIRSLVHLHPGRIDTGMVEHWAAKAEVEAAWRDCQQSAGQG